MQKDLFGNEVIENMPEVIIESPLDLLHKLAKAEEDYYIADRLYLKEYNNHLLTIDWDKINDERTEKGLTKLSNKEMKDAYIESLLIDYKGERDMCKLTYHRLNRMYEMMRKYSLDVLR